MSTDGSVTDWINGVKAGEELAAQRLWDRYYQKLLRMARKKLDGAPRRRADEEDIVLSAFTRFCAMAQQGHCPDRANRDDFWRMMLKFTAQKTLDEIEHERAVKRGGGKVRGESVFESGRGGGIADVIRDEPTPEFAAMVVETLEGFLQRLGSDDLRAVLIAKLEGRTNAEAAELLGCSVSTIERRMRMIRTIWKQEMKR